MLDDANNIRFVQRPKALGWTTALSGIIIEERDGMLKEAQSPIEVIEFGKTDLRKEIAKLDL